MVILHLSAEAGSDAFFSVCFVELAKSSAPHLNSEYIHHWFEKKRLIVTKNYLGKLSIPSTGIESRPAKSSEKFFLILF